MFYDLLNRDISNKNLRKPPHSEALKQQVHNSLSPVQKWWLDCTKEGEIECTLFNKAGANAQEVTEWGESSTEGYFGTTRTRMYEAYLKYCDRTKVREPKNRDAFFREFYKMIPDSHTEGRITAEGKVNRAVKIPPLGIARAELSKVLGLDEDFLK